MLLAVLWIDMNRQAVTVLRKFLPRLCFCFEVSNKRVESTGRVLYSRQLLIYSEDLLTPFRTL